MGISIAGRLGGRADGSVFSPVGKRTGWKFARRRDTGDHADWPRPRMRKRKRRGNRRRGVRGDDRRRPCATRAARHSTCALQTAVRCSLARRARLRRGRWRIRRADGARQPIDTRAHRHRRVERATAAKRRSPATWRGRTAACRAGSPECPWATARASSCRSARPSA